MTLALTLGMSVGYRRTLWMMIGELAGVALVAISGQTRDQFGELNFTT